ncbi:hypothetical protein AGMMS49975_24480 [Clostridia bacterium]|nr:hypothetical protein AGMMS49975_24480 [Clostridia bacterium]
MFTVKPLKIELLRADDPISLFLQKRTDSRYICFYRVIGFAATEYINNIDKELQGGRYLRLEGLPKIPADIRKYADCFNKWHTLTREDDLFNHKFPFTFSNPSLEWTAKLAYKKTIDAYSRETKNANESMISNFSIKILYWIDYAFPKLFEPKGGNPKVLYTGNIKNQECLFLYFLSLLGCDILYINADSDMPCETAAKNSLRTDVVTPIKRPYISSSAPPELP